MTATFQSSSGSTTVNHNGQPAFTFNETGLLTGVPPAMYNVLINPRMAIDQRNAGASQTITAGAALAYTVDRWYAYCTGANVTGQRVSGTAPNDYNYRFTGAASVTKIGFAQRIEALNSQHLAGQTATLSVDLANSLLTTVTWTAWYANTADTFGTLASPTRTQIATGTFTVTSTLTRYSTQISIPAAATTGIEIEFSVGAQTSGTWTIGEAQLVRGNSTVFEYRPIGVELALCQRYLPCWTASGSNQHIGTGFCYSTTQALIYLSSPVQTRVAPTELGASTGGTAQVLSAAAAGIPASGGVVYNNASVNGMAVVATVTSGLVAGNGTLLICSNLIFYGTGCEL